MGSHAALISELEAAKEGTRALSDKVLVALGQLSESHKLMPDRPDPTRDLQDIADLVPEDMKWGVDSTEAWVGQGDDEDAWGNAKTPALSLCIALLKAMEAEGG